MCSSSLTTLNYLPGAKWIKGLTNDLTGDFTGGHFSDIIHSLVFFTARLDRTTKFVELQK
ncbi:hypothetical protein BGW80DRAFT_1176806 [Lactifluus volemus]|nr:hypothetical protein BGW80DRAFT_1176806 [Lactifluus volemus]